MNTPQQNSGESPVKQALREIRRLKAELEIERARRTEPLAIVGIGVRLPGGVSTPEGYWKLLIDGVDAVGPIPRDRWPHDEYYDPDAEASGRYYVQKGGFLAQVDGFDPEFFGIAPLEAITMDPQQRLLLETTWEALEHAGIPATSLRQSRTGVFLGIAGTDYHRLVLGDRDADTHASTGTLASVAAGRISYVLGLNGPAVSVDTACSSSLVAVHLAARSLRTGESDLAIAAGVNLMLSPELTVNFCRAGMLSRDGRCKTFDADADGYIRSEGCGVVLMKRLSDAQRDGDRIFGVVRGTAINQDGRSSGLTAPSGPAQAAVIRDALADAGVGPEAVRFIEAHGTGTSLGDPIEVQAIGSVFSGRTSDDPVLLGSVKTNLGHLEGAAGIAGLIKAVLALQHGEIPPHLHFRTPNPYIPWDELPVAVATQRTSIRADQGEVLAGVSSFGFSGTNAHVILGRGPVGHPAEAAATAAPDLLVLSAPDHEALQAVAAEWAEYLESGTAPFADACHTSRVGRTHFSERVAVVAADAAAAARLIRQWLGSSSAARLVADAAGNGNIGNGVGGRAQRLTQLANRWTGGANVDWNEITPAGVRRVSAPTYPFRRRRFWYEAATTDAPADRPSADVWSETLQAATRQSGAAPVEMAVASYAGAWEALNELTLALGRNALVELGAFRDPDSVTDLDGVLATTGIQSAHRRITGRWLEALADSGVLERAGSGYRAPSPVASVDTTSLWQRVEAALAGDQPLLEYIRHCAGLLVDVLAGRVSPLETLFPGGSFDVAVRLYHESSLLRYVNGIGAAALERFIAERPAGAPVRVLEIGAGTGGTTAFLTSVLPEDRSDYLYTDVSDIFLDFAAERFGNIPFLRTGLFDLEKEPVDQGIPEGEWDVVVAANVIHAARNIREAVNRARRLLAPGGILLLVESTGHHPWHDITTGLIEGWQHFEDDLRTDTPLLTPDVWVELLRSEGFEAAATLPEAASPASVLKQHLVLARVEGSAPAAHSIAPRSLGTFAEPQSTNEAQSGASARAEQLVDEAPSLSAAMTAILSAPEGDREELAISEIRDAVVAVLRLEADRPPARDARLLDLGLDSLMAVRLRNLLQKRLELPEPLPSTLVFDHPTIRQIARFILDRHAHKGAEEVATAEPATTGEAELAGMSDSEVEALLLNRLSSEEFR